MMSEFADSVKASVRKLRNGWVLLTVVVNLTRFRQGFLVLPP